MATVDLERILATLNQTGFSRREPAAYSAIASLIRSLQDAVGAIKTINNNDNPTFGFAPKTATYITVTNELLSLPNSRRILAGLGIILDVSVPGQITINSSGSGGFIPMTTGAYPFEIMGIGQSVMIIHYTGT